MRGQIMSKRRREVVKGYFYPNEKENKFPLAEEVMKRNKMRSASPAHSARLLELISTTDDDLLSKYEKRFESDKDFYYLYLYGRSI